MAGAIPYSSPPKLNEKQLEQLRIRQRVYKEKLSMEEALKLGYVPDEPWGMSELRPDDK